MDIREANEKFGRKEKYLTGIKLFNNLCLHDFNI